jgi:hypothetical protein
MRDNDSEKKMTETNAEMQSSTKEHSYPLTKQMEIHNFIYDENQIKAFANLIGTTGNTHVIYIIARSKYNKTVKFRTHFMNPKAFFDYTPEKFLQLVRKYEVPIGQYIDDNGNVCPNDSLVIYCSTNGRDTKKAARKILNEIIDGAMSNTQETNVSHDQVRNTQETNPYIYDHLQGRLTSAIMSSKCKIKIITMDIDDKSQLCAILAYLKEINVQPIANIETRGGYHLLLPICKGIDLVYKKYSKIITIGDTFCPVPGTLQAGFPVRFV